MSSKAAEGLRRRSLARRAAWEIALPAAQADLIEALGWIAEHLPYAEAWAEGLKLRHDPKIPASFIARATLEAQIERAQRILRKHGYAEITPSVKRIGE